MIAAMCGMSVAGLVTLVNRVFQCEGVVAGTYTATMTLNADGTISISKTGGGDNTTMVNSGPTNWYTPTTGGIGSSWYARITNASMDGGTFGGTLSGAWQSLATAKTINATANDGQFIGGSCNIELSTSGSGPASVVLPVYLLQTGWSP